MFTATHQYVNVIGNAYNAAERWQFGFRVTDSVGSNDAVAFAVGTIVKNWWSATGPFTAITAFGSLNTHNLTEIKVATILPDGTYPPGSVSSSFFFVPEVIGAAAPAAGVLPQNSTAVTLTTNIPRGLASKGRIYLPPSARMTIAADGRLPIGTAQLVVDSTRALINAINADPTVGNIVVMSRGHAERGPAKPNGQPTYTYPNPGVTAVVSGIKVGRVVDTQRRRRRSLTELPLVSAIP